MEKKNLEEKVTESQWIGKWVGMAAAYTAAALACHALDVKPEYAALLALPIVKGAQIAGGVGKYVGKYFA